MLRETGDYWLVKFLKFGTYISDLMPKLNACRALVLEYIFEVPDIFLKFRTYISDLMQKLNARRALVLEYIFEVQNIFLKFRIYF